MKKLGIFILVFIALFLGVFAAGEQGDPIITLSYLNKIYSQVIETNVSTKANDLLRQSTTALNAAYESYKVSALARVEASNLAKTALTKAAYNKVIAGSEGKTSAPVTLKKGDKLTGKPGSGFIFLSGMGTLSGGAKSEIINVTAGGVRKPGNKIAVNIYYMISADDGSGVTVTSDTATVKLLNGCGIAVPKGTYTPSYTALADKLKAMGLFLGTSKGYELERTLTRQEGIVMLLRMLGEAQIALDFNGTSPFTDLGYWADGIKYVNYAYSRGFVKGVSLTAFAPGGIADSKVYFTYVLRALGYDDLAGDFNFNTSHEKALELGLITKAQYEGIAKSGFRRDHTVLVSYNALFTTLKNSNQTLGQRLVAQGVITQVQYDSAE